MSADADIGRSALDADDVRSAVTDAIQVADRIHLWQNLCEAADKTVTAHHRFLREPVEDDADAVVPEPSIQPKPAPSARPRPADGGSPRGSMTSVPGSES